MERTLHDISEEWLVVEAQCGDREAWTLLIGRWERRVHHRVVRHLGAPNRDVVQDVWVSVARGMRRLNDPARFGPWVYRIVDRRCVDEIRRRVRDRRHQAESIIEASVVADSADDVEILRLALQSIDMEQRMLLSMHHGDGLSVRAIARNLGIKQGTVKSRLSAARAALRARLEQMDHDQPNKKTKEVYHG